MTGGRRLGRGLESLLGPVTREQAEAQGALRELPVAQVRPNPFQPRTRFDPAGLAELVASIAASGLLQPITVRRPATRMLSAPLPPSSLPASGGSAPYRSWDGPRCRQ